ncbi:DUF1206 domain-containing protein [Tessaracoccus terricola]
METPDRHDAERAARKVEESRTYRVSVRAGLVAYGVMHLLIAFLTFRLATGGSDEDASQTGALRALANSPMGPALLGAVAVGFLALVVWQVIDAFMGHREYSGGQRWRKRVASVGKAVVYLVLGASAANIALGDRSDGDTAEAAGGAVMSLPFGQVLVAITGLAIAALGVWLASKAFTDKWEEELAGELGVLGTWAARVGHFTKGLVYAGLGALFVWAAANHEPESTGGMDAALLALRSAPFGPWLLGAAAFGLACYGLYCFFWARRAKV